MDDKIAKTQHKIEDSKSYVKIRYSVRVANGRVLKGAGEPEVMDFVTGYRQVVPGLELRLLGHEVGDKLSFSVPPEEAFGPRHQELVIEKSKSDFHFPPGWEPYPGMELPLLTGGDNAPDTVIIREVREDSIVIDANHPLSGATLEYDLEIVEARPATSSDMCSEWDEQKSGDEEPCCSSPHQIILGAQDPEVN
ncbi:MAG: FKBP-type peptidyl-prolyl cis-trans isomerase [Desulfomonile tiedjei]|nr:FKBP-type peptidyl-prolyl cis-trans isomerase [Desulfomonile tiedjei]